MRARKFGELIGEAARVFYQTCHNSMPPVAARKATGEFVAALTVAQLGPYTVDGEEMARQVLAHFKRASQERYGSAQMWSNL